MPRLITDSRDPYERRYTFPKWNCYIRVTDDHRLFRYLPEFASWSRAQHIQSAIAFLTIAIVTEKAYAVCVRQAERAYGTDGALISGVHRDHYPEPIKDCLRQLATMYGDQYQKSIAHWQAAGRQAHTWRAYRDSRRQEIYPS